MRRVVTPLLAVGAALLVAAMVWPTEHMTAQSPAGAMVPLFDIWLWGRVRPLTEVSSTEVEGSVAVLVALGVAAALGVGAAVLWLRVPGRRAGRRQIGTVAAVTVVAAIATAALALSVDVGSFGWFSPGGPPIFTRTVVAMFPAVAFALWAVALLVMVAVLLRRRGGADEAPGEPTPA